MIEIRIFKYESFNASLGLLYADGQAHSIQNISSINPVTLKQKLGWSRACIFSGLAMMFTKGILASFGVYSVLMGIGLWGFSKPYYVLHWTAHNGKKNAFVSPSLTELDKVERALHTVYRWQNS